MTQMMRYEYDIKRENADCERQKIWRVLSLISRFLTPSATITLNASRSQQTPRFFFHPRTETVLARLPGINLLRRQRNVPVMLTPVIGNNVCRERIEKEKGTRVRKKRMDSTSFLLRVTHLICVEYVPRAKYPENSNSAWSFRGNVTGKTREITLAELNLCRHYARSLHATQSHVNFCNFNVSRARACFSSKLKKMEEEEEKIC